MASTGPTLAQLRISSIHNVAQAEHFTYSIAGLLALFTIFRAAWLYKHHSETRKNAAPSIFTKGARACRRIFLRRVPVFQTAGHVTIITMYVIITIILCVTSPPFPKPWSKGMPLNWLQKRIGWMAVVNLCVTIVMGIKNNPIQYLTGFSHERLNILHRAAGWTTLVCWLIHGFTYIGYFEKQKNNFMLHQPNVIHGYTAGAALFVTAMSGLPFIRKRFYEAFVKVHTVGYILLLVCLQFHQQQTYKKVVWFVIFMALVLLLSRAARLFKIARNSWGNYATLIPLEGVTKVVLSRSIKAKAGEHIFITIPAVRGLESHPFSISDTENTQVRCRARGGFTKSLLSYAEKHPGARVRVVVEGPFGVTEDVGRFDKGLVIAGGVGATYLFAVALEVVRRKDWVDGRVVELIWVLQQQDHLEWFHEELKELGSSTRVNLTIYISRSPGSSSDLSLSATNTADEKNMVKQISALEASCKRHRVEYARPDISSSIETVIANAAKNDSILVAACGPAGLMHDCRDAVARGVTVNGPSVTFQCEQFGW